MNQLSDSALALENHHPREPTRWHVCRKQQAVNAGQRRQDRSERSGVAQRYGSQRQAVEEARPYLAEVPGAFVQIIAQQRMLVLGPHQWSAITIRVDQRIVPERLQKYGAAPGFSRREISEYALCKSR